MERRLQAGRIPQRVLDQQHTRRSDHLDQRLAEVVLGVGVANRVHHHTHRVKPRLGRRDGLLDDRLPNREVQLHRVEEGSVEVPANLFHDVSRPDDEPLGK